jgi:hypothetical protein
MHSIFIRCSQYGEAALRRIVSLSQDARGLPDTDVLSSVPNAAALLTACFRLIPPSREGGVSSSVISASESQLEAPRRS